MIVKRKVCWPLGVGLLSAFSCVGLSEPAHAGEWLVEVQSPDGKRIWPVRNPDLPSSTRPWVMPPNNGQLRSGEMNLVVGGDTGGSEEDTNTSDFAQTPQNQSTRSEASGSLQVICKWKAAWMDGETGQWIPDGSKPTSKTLKLTVESYVDVFGAVVAPLDQAAPGNGSVTVDVAGFGVSSDTVTREQREATSSDRSLRRTSYQNKEKVFVLPVPENPSASGEYKVVFSLTGISAKTSIVTGSQGAGLAYATAQYKIKNISPRNVHISSNIEPSYTKITSPSNLPIKPNPDGSFSFVIDESKLRDTTPLYTFVTPPESPEPGFTPFQIIGPWAVLIEPGSNGSMTVESAAKWISSPSPAFQAWMGSAKFTAQAEGLGYSPSYTWTEPSDSRNQNTGNTHGVDDLTAAPPSNSTPFYGIRLGSQPGGSDLVRSSTIGVAVTDAHGSLSDTYKVNWHLPLEKIGDLPSFKQRSIQQVIAPKSDDFSTPIEEPQTLDIGSGIEGAASVAALLLPAQAATVASIIGTFAGLVDMTWTSGEDVALIYSRETKWGDNAYHDGSNGSTNWHDSDHFDQGAYDLLGTPDGWRYCKLGLLKVHHWTRKRWTADVYDGHGYVISGAEPYADVDNFNRWEPRWEIDSATGTSQRNMAPPSSPSNPVVTSEPQAEPSSGSSRSGYAS